MGRIEVEMLRVFAFLGTFRPEPGDPYARHSKNSGEDSRQGALLKVRVAFCQEGCVFSPQGSLVVAEILVARFGKPRQLRGI